jgi:hypothetical protein
MEKNPNDFDKNLWRLLCYQQRLKVKINLFYGFPHFGNFFCKKNEFSNN